MNRVQAEAMLREHRARGLRPARAAARKPLLQILVDLEQLRAVDEQQMWAVFGMKKMESRASGGLTPDAGWWRATRLAVTAGHSRS